MTSIKYRWSANQDLQGIKHYYDDISPAITDRIFYDITHAIEVLKTFPLAGRPIEGRNERRIVTSKYGYVISYIADGHSVEIVGVFRYQNREL